MPINCTKRFYDSLSPLKRGSIYYLSFWGVIGTFIPFLNVYFRQALGFSGRQIGILAIFPPLMMLVVAPFVASLADRRHWRILLLRVTISGFGLLLLLATFPHTFIAWIVLRLVMAFFSSSIIPLADSIIARMSSRYGLNYGSMRLWGSFSFALASIVGGVLWERVGFRTMFVVAGLSLLPALFSASKLEEEPVTIERQKRQSLWEIRRDSGLVVLMVASFLVGATIHISVTFDGIYMNYMGGTQLFIGLMFGLAAFSELPTMHYSVAIARHLSGPKTLLMAYGLFTMAFLGYVLAWQPGILLVMAMIKGLGFGLFHSSTIRLTNERAPENWASTIQSMVTASAFGLAPMIAAPLGGEIYDRFGPKALFLCNSLLVGGAMLVCIIATVKRIFTDVKTEPPTLH
jgi:PPP family 3-phenylpropionic acid transporter